MIWAIIVLALLYIFWRMISGIYTTSVELSQKYKFGISVFIIAALLTAILFFAIEKKIVFLAFPITYFFAYSWKTIQLNNKKKKEQEAREKMQEQLEREHERNFQREQAEREERIRREEAQSRERMQAEQIKYNEHIRQENLMRQQHELEFRNRAELEAFLQQHCMRMGATTEDALQKATFRFREKDYPENDPYEKIIRRFLDQCMAEFERIIESMIRNQCAVKPSSELQLVEFVKASDILASYTYENTKTPEVLVNQALHTLLQDKILSKVDEEYLIPQGYGTHSSVKQQPELSFDELEL